MATKIQSEILGELIEDQRAENCWRKEKVEIALISKEIPVTFMNYLPNEDPTFVQDADKALENFLALNSLYKFEIAKEVLPNFEDFCSYVSDTDIPKEMKNVQVLNILNFVYPTEIFVSRRQRNDKDIYILMACECEWDPEHGLQLVFRQGRKLTRVSDQDGHLTQSDAFDIPDAEDKLLSAF